MANLLWRLPPDSQTMVALHGPPPWSEAEALLASLLHSFHLSLWGRAKKGPKPLPPESPRDRANKVSRRKALHARLIERSKRG